MLSDESGHSGAHTGHKRHPRMQDAELNLSFVLIEMAYLSAFGNLARDG
jgi:hypothetical protein